MEILNSIWQYVLPIGGGITFGAFCLAVILPFVKGTLAKVVSKIDVEKIESKAVDAGIDRLKDLSFKQNIQPLVKSELQKVVEVVDDKLSEKLGKVDEGYAKIVNILAKLGAYFDNSIAITDTAKEELKQAVLEAQNLAPVDVLCKVETISHAEAKSSTETEKKALPTVER